MSRAGFKIIVWQLFIVVLGSAMIGLYLMVPQYLYDTSDQFNLYTFIDTVSPELIDAFEQEFGVRVNMKHYDSLGEMVTVLDAQQGRGYDVVLSSDYSIAQLAELGLLAPLEHEQIPNREFLDKRLMGQACDPKNTYSLPFSWSIIGIGYNKQKLERLSDNPTMQAVFHPRVYAPDLSYKVVLTDLYGEIVHMVCLYVGKRLEDIDEHWDEIARILVEQKPYVSNYMGGNYEYLLASGLVDACLVEGPIMKKTIDNPEYGDRFGFAVPREGSIMTTENLCLLNSSRHKKLAHQFINFMLSRQSGILTWENGYNPSNEESVRDVSAQETPFYPVGQDFNNLRQIEHPFSYRLFERAWLDMKQAKV